MPERFVTFQQGLPPLPEDLLLARDRGSVLFITGAGISRPAPSGLPGFRGLVVEVYDTLDAAVAAKLHTILDDEAREGAAGRMPRTVWTDYVEGLTPAQQAEVRRFIQNEYDVVLGMLERRVDTVPGNMSSMRRRVVEILSRSKSPNALHASLVGLGQRYGRPFLATTNFDPLLGTAATRRRLSPSVYGLGAMPRPSRRADFNGIFHIHGAIPHDNRSFPELVLTDQDFGDVYLRRRIAADFVYDAARIFHLVLVGYSLTDAPMRYLMNAIAGDETHFPDIKRRYAIVPVRGEDPVEEADWRARGIIPIAYDQADKHAVLEHLLGEWAESVPPPGDDTWARRQIARITRTSERIASETDRSMFGYLVRRSTPSERRTLVDALSSKESDPDWLDAINAITREEIEPRHE